MSALFEPGNIGTMNLKNRFVRSATAEGLLPDNCRVNDRYIKAYSQLARGGVGLIITGNYYVNDIGRHIPRMIVMDRDETVGDLQKVVETVHQHGTKIVAQLNHAGRQSDPKIIGTIPLSPSPVRDKLSLVKPRVMSRDQIDDTIEAFGKAAGKVKEGGFDGLQIHAAHGYLINQFLSGYTNRRRDKWGGSLENRMRFLVEVYETIRSVVGPEYPVLIKINSKDFSKGGVTLGDAISVCKKLDELGIDAIEVSGGIAEKGLSTVKGDIPMDVLTRGRNFMERIMMRFFEKSLRNMSRFEEAYFLPHAAVIKKNVNAPVLAVGGMRNRAVMEQALESGQADFISLCRPFIRQPNLVNLMAQSNGDPISCTNCNRCTIEIVVQYNPMKCYCSEAPE